jgi:L-asparaginase / beta-aspartyl-peptidase
MAAIVVHGGAGEFTTRGETRAREGCRQVVESLRRDLIAGAPALDLAEAAVRALEDDPAFNAGTGSVPNQAGEVEMDAILVCGATLRFGAVAALRNVRNPIAVARRVLELGDPCMLAGEGAVAFARECGFAQVPTAELRSVSPAEKQAVHGTVGAVVLDQRGSLAAATSTGGIRGKRVGRIGDSPLIGCGALADDTLGGASATGHGEALMRVQITRTLLEHLRAGLAAKDAANAAIRDLHTRVQGRGGVICLDAHGRIGFAHNTPQMAVCGIDAGGQLLTHL